MARSCLHSSWRIWVTGITLLLPLTIRSQPPTAQSGSHLPAADEKDSYEIYSMLLKTEMPPQWNITTWTIQKETQTLPGQSGAIETCLTILQNQEGIYRPLVQDYVAKNKTKFVLERKFDLPVYALTGQNEAHPQFKLIFHVSAIGFDADRKRALVYAGHICGSLCAGGRYHVLVKMDGKWQVDHEFRGASCIWGA
jgi:hypothetical protein